jgi:hypothetical protein
MYKPSDMTADGEPIWRTVEPVYTSRLYGNSDRYQTHYAQDPRQRAINHSPLTSSCARQTLVAFVNHMKRSMGNERCDSLSSQLRTVRPSHHIWTHDTRVIFASGQE